jgi:BlaI family transcriptional regulator, penicillinase repressor
MQKLAKREEQIMQALWTLGEAFIRDVVAALPEPQPHYNSVGTMIGILEGKGFLSHRKVGNMLSYYPVISKMEYQRHTMKDIVAEYFDNSYASMLTFFAEEGHLSEKELKEISALIKNKKK